MIGGEQWRKEGRTKDGGHALVEGLTCDAGHGGSRCHCRRRKLECLRRLIEGRSVVVVIDLTWLDIVAA